MKQYHIYFCIYELYTGSLDKTTSSKGSGSSVLKEKYLISVKEG